MIQISKSDYSQLVEAIQKAELETTGEIRLHLSRKWFERDALRSAWKCFNRLNMQATRDRNGVLIYLNLRARKLALVGDSGVYQKVGEEKWNHWVSQLVRDFGEREKSGTGGTDLIIHLIQQLGLELKRHFASHSNTENRDELSQEITED